MIARRHALALVAATSALAALVGCSRTLDMDKLKGTLKTSLAAQIGIDVASVTCPEKREMKAGDTFECTAKTAGGSSVTVAVKQGDDQGNINWEVTKSEGLVNLKALEPQVVSGLKEQTGVDAKVDCGPKKFREAKEGDVFMCKATSDSETIDIEATVKDRSGNVTWKTKPAGEEPPAEAAE